MSLNTQSLQPVINFLWTVADDVLVNTYQKGKYKDVILPMVVIRRLDLLLEPSKNQVLKTFSEYKSKLQNLDSLLTNTKHGSGLAFYNTSPFTLKKLLDAPKNLRSNFENYLNGFSENVQDIIKQFKFRNEIETLDEADILFSLIEKFCSPKIELHPDKLPPLAMGYVYEDLVRRFNEENNEEAGEHFTPREIIDLMTQLVFLPVKDKIQQGTFLVYDPCVGSGGMLTIAKNFMLNPDGLVKSKATVHLYGQESTPFIYATCKSDMLIKGEDPNKIAYGSTLSAYGFDNNLKFDFMLTNPPYGKTWAPDKKALGVGEKGKIIDKRFILKGSYKQEAVTSRVNDGQLMFVLHMLSKMKDTELGSRIASVHNGSALFTGDAGGGESEIRRYIIENDLLEGIIALPNDMFYNTGIPTYIFLFTNRKAKHRKGKVQLINATGETFYSKLRKSLGKKRVEYKEEHIAKIEKMFLDFAENEYSKIFDNNDFGYSQITVHRPLKLSMVSCKLSVISGKLLVVGDKMLTVYNVIKNEVAKFFGDAKHSDFNKAVIDFSGHLKKQQLDFSEKEIRDVLMFFAKEDETAALVYKSLSDYKKANYNKPNHAQLITNNSLKDTENIPLKEDIQEFFEKEVLPFAPDAWWDKKETKIGYEINFNKYFYQYQPPRSLKEIAADIFAIEKETDGLLKEIIA